MKKEITSTTKALPRVVIEEGQEFLINGAVFAWHFTNPELKEGIMINLTQTIQPEICSVTQVKQSEKRAAKEKPESVWICESKSPHALTLYFTADPANWWTPESFEARKFGSYKDCLKYISETNIWAKPKKIPCITH